MPRPWKLLERIDTPEGPLELRQRDELDFMISISGRVLMSSIIHRSETLVAELGVERAAKLPAPQVLIGGFGLGFTLRAALDRLPKQAQVTVAELNPVVIRWGRGALAPLTGNALSDPRVEVFEGDVTQLIRAAANGARPRFDAIVLDLYLGPMQGREVAQDPLYGTAILAATRRALNVKGCYAVWGEDPDPTFEARLHKAGFSAHTMRNRGGGPRHVIYVASKD